MPVISVIVPVYKVEKYLSRCVDSILMQSFSDFELILVDDGSPDHSGAICEEYAVKDERIKVLHKKNGGLSSARNAGLDIAIGEYVTFVDSDDVININYLLYLYETCQKYNADIAMGQLIQFYNDSELENMPIDFCVNVDILSSEDALNCLFDAGKRIPHYISSCCKLIKRELFQEIRFPEKKFFEDEFTTYKLYYNAKKIAVIDEELYYYYVNVEGITKNLTLIKRLDEYDAQWERIEFLAEKKLFSLYKKALLRFLHTAQWDLIACNKKNENIEREQKFRMEYRNAFKQAKKHGIIDLKGNFDYYVVAYPKRALFYRIRKLIKL